MTSRSARRVSALPSDEHTTPLARRPSSSTFVTTVSVRMLRLGLDRAGLMNACAVLARSPRSMFLSKGPNPSCW